VCSYIPVLVVGAGPSGLTLAIELIRRGVDCRIVDKAPELFIGSRGKGLQPRSLEVFEDLGVLDAVLAGGAPFPAFRMYSGHTILWERGLDELLGTQFPERTSNVPYPRPWLIPQWRTDEILHDRFTELGGRAELSTRLTGFTQDGTGVTATLQHDGRQEQVRADYLVGADGGRSFVRKRTGVGFAGKTYDSERTLIGDVRAKGVEGIFCHLFTSGDLTKRFSLWNLPRSDYFQFVAAVGADDKPELDLTTVQAILEERSGRTDIRLYDLNWISLYRINVRMAERFRIGRVFLAGDAAHVHSSASGQGLNTSVQDAYNLGWKLAAVLGGASGSLLDTYQDERLPVAAELLEVSTTMHRRSFRAPTAPLGSPAIHQLDITYRDSTLAVDDRPKPGRLQAGDRAPDAPLHTNSGTPIRLFEIFRGPHWTLLGFGTEVTDLARRRGTALLAYSVVQPGEQGNLVDTHGHATRDYHVAKRTYVLIRPDGHVGLITSNPRRVPEYLSQVLGP
jgi:2-polyprenyl-6-methoxyphenol hydroxylase-like FAD-dependent oxidoreductase